MSLFPMFVKLEGRPCLVVGAGAIAEAKIPGLLEAGAKVRVVAPQANDAVAELARAGKVTWEQRAFQPSDLDSVFLVIAATSLYELNGQVFVKARERGILCNAVDDPENCDFYYGSVVRRGDLQIAISTAGHSPALSQRLRQELELQFGPEYSEWLRELGEKRAQLFSQGIDPEQRRQELHAVASRKAYESRCAARKAGLIHAR
jgi:precorrin-2 dehydrogenase